MQFKFSLGLLVCYIKPLKPNILIYLGLFRLSFSAVIALSSLWWYHRLNIPLLRLNHLPFCCL